MKKNRRYIRERDSHSRVTPAVLSSSRYRAVYYLSRESRMLPLVRLIVSREALLTAKKDLTRRHTLNRCKYPVFVLNARDAWQFNLSLSNEIVVSLMVKSRDLEIRTTRARRRNLKEFKMKIRFIRTKYICAC